MQILAPRTLLPLLAMLLAAAPRAHGQRTPGDGLERRSRAFLSSLGLELPETLATFFPRRGEWTWTQTARSATGERRVTSWRFAAAETERVLESGPVCESVRMMGDVGLPARTPAERAVRSEPGGTLDVQAMMSGPAWRRAGPTRFVPPGAPSGSPTFVEWRREDGRWVVAAIGDEPLLGPEPPGVPANTIRLDSVRPAAAEFPPAEPYAARTGWYARHEPVALRGRYFLKYGLPRFLGADEVTRIGSVNGVGVYAEAGMAEEPGYVYIVVGPGGSFQPYQVNGPPPCHDPPDAQR